MNSIGVILVFKFPNNYRSKVDNTLIHPCTKFFGNTLLCYRSRWEGTGYTGVDWREGLGGVGTPPRGGGTSSLVGGELPASRIQTFALATSFNLTAQILFPLDQIQ